jgi:hypothetical protein
MIRRAEDAKDVRKQENENLKYECITLCGKLVEKLSLGRPRRRSEDNIKMVM